MPCIFVGYGDQEFEYRLSDPRKKTVTRHRDVIFYENQTLVEDITESGDADEISMDNDSDEDTDPSPVQGTSGEDGKQE